VRAKGVQQCENFAWARPVHEYYVIDVDRVLHVGDSHITVLVSCDDPTRRFLHGADVTIPRDHVYASSTACEVGQTGELHLSLEFVIGMGWF
jgi:hypothetical protein